MLQNIKSFYSYKLQKGYSYIDRYIIFNFGLTITFNIKKLISYLFFKLSYGKVIEINPRTAIIGFRAHLNKLTK